MRTTIPPRPADTAEDAERVQVSLLRSASVARRMRVALGLSATIVTAARAALVRDRPDASSRDHDIRFVEIHYGGALAAALRAELARRDQAGQPAP